MVQEGSFREDLYYRLNVFRIRLPPLRERKGDLPALTELLLARLSSRLNKAPPRLGEEAMAKLSAYSFPGNIRELENILERALIYSDGGMIGAADIELSKKEEAPQSALPAGPPPGKLPGGNLEDIERKAILEALERMGGNRTRASQELGISRKTLLNKLKAWGLG
jgi:DNA-binding NtrC family response regulator